jgi:hypothetical protein
MQSSSLRIVSQLLLASLLAPAGLAQLTPGSWLQSRGGAFGLPVPPTPASLQCTGGMSGQPPEMAGPANVHSEDGAEFWFTTPAFFTTPGVFRATLNGSQVVGTTRLANQTNLAGMTRRGNRLWLVTNAGSLLSLDPAAALQTPVVEGSLPIATTGSPRGITTDGRELYICCASSSPTANVWAFDPVGTALRPVALVAGSVLSIDFDALGQLRCIDTLGYMHRVHPHDGTTAILNPGSPMPLWSTYGQNTHGSAHDVWSRRSAVSGTYMGFSPTSPRPYAFLAVYDEQVGSWTMTSSATYDTGRTVESVAAVPFALYGRECPNSVGSGPRIGAVGLPQVGGTFSVTLRGAEPNGLGICWFGLSAGTWTGVGSLPFDLAPLGAAGCNVLTAPDVIQAANVVGPDGRAIKTVQLPSSPSITGQPLFAQWAASSAVQALGIGTSDALAVRIR